MNSRTRSRKPASIGSNHSSRNPTAISGFEPRTGNFVLLFVMAWSPPAHNAGIVWVSAPGDYATFNSNHTPDGTGFRPAAGMTYGRRPDRGSPDVPPALTPRGRAVPASDGAVHRGIGDLPDRPSATVPCFS